MGQRRRAREYALQLLFQVDLAGEAADDALERFWLEREAGEAIRAYAERLVRGVLADREAIDGRITGAARRWRIERMPVVDRNVLRVAVFELLIGDDPAAVVIDEAIEVARRFGNRESGAFVNGILDSIRRSIDVERDARGD